MRNGSQRLMMAREDRIGQIVEIAVTNLAVIALPFTLALAQMSVVERWEETLISAPRINY